MMSAAKDLTEDLFPYIRAKQKVDKLIMAAEDISNVCALDSGNLYYFPRNFLSINFPAKKIEGNSYEYFNGEVISKIISDKFYGVPYGKLPRVLCIWLTTQVVLKKSRYIYLGGNMCEFLKALGLYTNAGERGAISRFINQINSLFRSMFIVESKSGDLITYENLFFVKKVVVVGKKSEGGQWNSYVEVSNDFFEMCNNSVPIDMRVIRVIRSSLALDLYIWITWRMFILKNKNNCFFRISWDKLFLKFGYGYVRNSSGKAHFKQSFLKSLRDIKVLYMAIRFDFYDNGVVFYKSEPHVKTYRNYRC